MQQFCRQVAVSGMLTVVSHKQVLVCAQVAEQTSMCTDGDSLLKHLHPVLQQNGTPETVLNFAQALANPEMFQCSDFVHRWDDTLTAASQQLPASCLSAIVFMLERSLLNCEDHASRVYAVADSHPLYLELTASA